MLPSTLSTGGRTETGRQAEAPADSGSTRAAREKQAYLGVVYKWFAELERLATPE